MIQFEEIILIVHTYAFLKVITYNSRDTKDFTRKRLKLKAC